MGYIPVNPNPRHINTGDCVIRAICLAEGKTWDDVFLDLMVLGFFKKDMIESNKLWGSYLHDLGYTRHIIPDTCPDCYTVNDFANDNPRGIFVLGTGTHAIAVIDGNYLDSYDSGDKVVLYYWEKGV